MIFAQAQWAAGGIAIVAILSWGVVIVASVAFLVFGITRTWSGGTRNRIIGAGMTCCGVLLPFLFYPAVCEVFFFRHGHYPLDQKRQLIPAPIGANSNDIRESWGEPHSVSKTADRETWLYWQDAFEFSFWVVEIGSDGRIVKSFGD